MQTFVSVWGSQLHQWFTPALLYIFNFLGKTQPRLKKNNNKWKTLQSTKTTWRILGYVNMQMYSPWPLFLCACCRWPSRGSRGDVRSRFEQANLDCCTKRKGLGGWTRPPVHRSWYFLSWLSLYYSAAQQRPVIISYQPSSLKLNRGHEQGMNAPCSNQPDIISLYFLNIRWCHIKGAICSVFKHQYIVVKLWTPVDVL